MCVFFVMCVKVLWMCLLCVMMMFLLYGMYLFVVETIKRTSTRAYVLVFNLCMIFDDFIFLFDELLKMLSEN